MRKVNLSSYVQKHSKEDATSRLIDIYEEVREQIISDAHFSELLNLSVRGNERAETELQKFIDGSISENDYYVEGKTKQELLDYLSHNIYGLGPAHSFMFDPDVSEIMVNGYGPDEPIRYEKNGYKYVSDKYYLDEQQVLNTITRMLFPLGETVNDGKPSAETTLPDGSRLTVAIPPVAINGPSFTIRRFTNLVITPEEYIELGSGTQEMFDFLKLLTEGRANILVCGGTSTGKTTLLRALCSYIPDSERILTIEDTEELQLKKHDPSRDVLAFLAQRGRLDFSIRDCLVLALRERPDRIIVGEVRGAESVDLLDAMRTGHEAMGTLHVSTPVEAIERLGREIRAIDPSIDAEILYDEIARTVDIIVQLKFFKHKGQRILVSITEPITYDKGLKYREIFKFTPEGFVFNQTLSKELSEKVLLNGGTELLNTRWISEEITEEERRLYQ